MKKRKRISFVLTLVLLIGTLNYFALPSSALSVSATGACLINADGTVLYEKNAHVRMPMASTTKIMTAIVAIEKLDLNKSVKVADVAVGVEGSSMYLQKGETANVKDLLYGLMLPSGCDAAAELLRAGADYGVRDEKRNLS